jgi:ABC-type transport system involved in cytochrome c biogenesis permease subunit
MIAKISIVCFAATYGLALLLELARVLLRCPAMKGVFASILGAGLTAHSLYLWHRATHIAAGELPLSSWYDWYLVAAWILSAGLLLLTVTRSQSGLGVFILPLILGLVSIAYPFREGSSFPRAQAISYWGVAHGVALLLGTVTVTFGFAAGVMYLVQSYRLKKRLPLRDSFRLPSLEWLQKANQQMLLVSTFLVALGVLAGIVLNAVKRSGGTGALPWTDSLVLTSGLLLLWLIAATTFEFLYKPAQQGRKVAYLTVASFGFLSLALAMNIWGGSQHASARGGSGSAPPPQEARP